MKILHSSIAGKIFSRLSLILQRTIDRDQWRAAPSWRERLGAVSWRLVGALAAVPVIAVGCCLIVFKSAEVRAYPPPLPTKAEMEVREQGLGNFRNQAPAGLADANRSLTETSAS